MSYISQGQMTFLTRHVDKKEWMKPAEKLQKAPIHIGNVSLVVESQLGLEMPGSMHCLIRTGLQGKFLPLPIQQDTLHYFKYPNAKQIQLFNASEIPVHDV